jgi:hypothetical protein
MKIIVENGELIFTTKDNEQNEEFNKCWNKGHLHFVVKYIGCHKGVYKMILSPSIQHFTKKKGVSH